MTAQERLDLIEEVHNWCYNATVTYEEGLIGVALAYLYPVIARGEAGSFHDDGTCWGPFLALMRRGFPEGHPVWQFFRFEEAA